VPIPTYLPEAVETSPEVWFSESTGEVAIRYGDSVVIEYVPWVSDQRPEDEYDTMVKEWGVGEATTVAGRPAWVVPADAARPGEPPVPVVHVAVDGVEVTLYGRMELSELVKVADSLAPLEQIATGVS
jgi:hypothetical protein